MYTGKTVSFPNNHIFSGGISNFTKKDLLFWHHFDVTLFMGETSLESVHNTLNDIIQNIYIKLLKNPLYNESEARRAKPKIRLEITEQGIKIHVRILVHFYLVTETHNAIMMALTKAHQEGKIQLLEHKDYHWISTKKSI